MKPDGYYTGFADRLSTRCRRWSRPLRAIAITLLLLLLPIAGNPASAAPGPDAHVYLLRGVLNIFSLGLDDIAAKLQRQGINATVANYLSWESLADEAAAEYRSGRIKTIVLVGHSSGATVLPDMVGPAQPARCPRHAGDRSGFGVPDQPVGTRWTLFELLRCQWGRHAGRQDQPVPWQPGECRRRRNGCRAPLHRQERGHAAEGHRRDRLRRP